MTWMVALTALSAGFQFASGMAQAKAFKDAAALEAAQMDEQREMIKLQASQDEADRRQQLRILEASNRAGVSYDFSESTSFMALELMNEREAERDVARIKTNASSKSLQVARQKEQTLMRGRNQAAQARMQAFGNLFGQGAKIAKIS